MNDAAAAAAAADADDDDVVASISSCAVFSSVVFNPSRTDRIGIVIETLINTALPPPPPLRGLQVKTV